MAHGGDHRDLWAFNDERVARAIFDSEIPVISAVGHEPDVTISDFVADVRASTPSNAAELAVPDMGALLQQLYQMESRMAQSEQNRVQQYKKRLQAITEKRVMQDPMAFIQDKRLLLDHVHSRMALAGSSKLESNLRRFTQLSASLDALSPLKVLGRGYAMAQTAGGDVLKSTAQINVGDRLRLQLGQGSIKCLVEEKNDGKEIL